MVEGIFGAVVRKGAEEAGAVYVIVNHLDGSCHLFGPAPGASHDETGERLWVEEASPPSGPGDAMAILDRRTGGKLGLRPDFQDRRGEDMCSGVADAFEFGHGFEESIDSEDLRREMALAATKSGMPRTTG